MNKFIKQALKKLMLLLDLRCIKLSELKHFFQFSLSTAATRVSIYNALLLSYFTRMSKKDTTLNKDGETSISFLGKEPVETTLNNS